MATNPFFSNYDFFNEQQLIDDLVIESIQIYGVDTFYVTRKTTPGTFDPIMNEDRLMIFDAAYNMEVYVKSVDGFQGEGDFLSKFGLQIRDQAVFTVAIRTFEKYATRYDTALIRPKEGDLVYLPMNKKFFKIMHVEHESVFYQNGALQVYDLKTELFEYSNERFQTGIQSIDTHYADYKTESIENLDQLTDFDPISNNLTYEEIGNDILDFSETDPFSETIFPPSTYTTTGDDVGTTVDDDTITIDQI